MTSFWSAYIIVLTLITIIGTYWLLFANRSRPADSEAKTGHVYDGIEEYDNPLPAWWLYMFVITGVFGVGYLVAFPGLGSFEGLLKWTQIDEWQREVQRAEARYEPVFAAYRDQTIEQIAADPQAVRMGQRIFANNCSQCHGSDARGSKGFPNLTDHQWNWGGQPEQIRETIAKGRTGVMTPMGAAVGSPEDVRNLANHVLSLSGAPHDSVRANLGREKFMVCAACHGADGKGNAALGAPNLTSGIFTHGPGVESHIVNMINSGKTGVMPAWESKFTPEQLTVLTAYVWGRGGGEPAAAKN